MADSLNSSKAPTLGAPRGMVRRWQSRVWLLGVTRRDRLAVPIEELILLRKSIGLMVSIYTLHRLRKVGQASRVPAVFGWHRPGGRLPDRGSEENHRFWSQFLEPGASR